MPDTLTFPLEHITDMRESVSVVDLLTTLIHDTQNLLARYETCHQTWVTRAQELHRTITGLAAQLDMSTPDHPHTHGPLFTPPDSWAGTATSATDR
jgi:hypothetical protein